MTWWKPLPVSVCTQTWFRIGGVAHDLPRGWDRLLREFLEWMPKRLDSYEKAALRNTILKGRSQGVAAYGAKEALEWGTTGAGCARPDRLRRT